MVIGLRPASQAARIGPSCPGAAAPARSDAPVALDQPLEGPNGLAYRFSPKEPCGAARPRRRASLFASYREATRCERLDNRGMLTRYRLLAPVSRPPE